MGCTSSTVIRFRPLLIQVYHIANKPRGLKAARKLRNTRRDNRWVRFPLGLPCFTSFADPLRDCWGTPFHDLRRTNHTKSALLETSTKHHPQEGPHTQRVSFSRRLASRRNSPILPSASVCVYSSSRTGRRSLLSFPYVLPLRPLVIP
jgi:hypothetical protein